jgi:uncharacterized membrane protein
MEWLRRRWSDLRSGLWLFPGLVVAGLTALAFAAIQVDRTLGATDVGFGGGPAAARGVLAAIAGSFVTVAGLTFSLTIVVLQLASSQYSPRILRGFLADRITQLTAGVFIGVFAYALVVLRSVRGDPAAFVPSIAVSAAIVLALAALVVLLAFIDHVAKLIQVSNIAGRIGAETCSELARGRQVDDRVDEIDAERLVQSWHGDDSALRVHVRRAGYLRAIDVAAATRRLADVRARVALLARPGDLVVPDEPVAEVWWHAGAGLDADAVADAVLSAVHVANERDLRDDPGFGVRQLADIAIRALSPGVNDPTTAVTCIAYIRAALVEDASHLPPPRIVESDGVQVVLAPRHLDRDAAPLVELAHHAANDPRTAAAVERTVAAVARAARLAGRGEEATRVEAAFRIATDAE